MTNTTQTIVAALIAAAFTSQAAKADLTGSLETKAVSNYTYRGQVVDRNPVYVPTLSLQAPLFDGGTLQASVEQILGTKGSTFFRSQYNVGVSVNVGRLTVTPGYLVTAFPERDARTGQSVTGQVSFNDAGLLPVKLQPTLSVEKSTDPKGGYWYEASVSPGKSFDKFELTVPVAVGASSNSYYTANSKNLQYAYASVGLNAAYRVTERLAVKAGVTGYTTDSRLSNSSSNFVQSQVGVSVSF